MIAAASSALVELAPWPAIAVFNETPFSLSVSHAICSSGSDSGSSSNFLLGHHTPAPDKLKYSRRLCM
eukprot:4625732-Karenia_brevis.AAC.1